MIDSAEIADFRAQKIATSRKIFDEAKAAINAVEERMFTLKRYIRRAPGFIYTPMVLGFLGGITAALLIGLGVNLGLCSAVSFAWLIIPILMVFVPAGMYIRWSSLMSAEACAKAKAENKELAKRCPLLAWKEVSFDYFVARHHVPPEVVALVRRIRQHLPEARLVIEFTTIAEFPLVNDNLYDWQPEPDPILHLLDGSRRHALLVWDEQGCLINGRCIG